MVYCIRRSRVTTCLAEPRPSDGGTLHTARLCSGRAVMLECICCGARRTVAVPWTWQKSQGFCFGSILHHPLRLANPQEANHRHIRRRDGQSSWAATGRRLPNACRSKAATSFACSAWRRTNSSCSRFGCELTKPPLYHNRQEAAACKELHLVSQRPWRDSNPRPTA